VNRRPDLRTLRIITLGLILTLSPTAALAGSDSGAPLHEQAADLAIVRPLGILPIVTGALVFVVAYPVALATGSSIDVVEICLEDPIRHTFRRPIGEL
jgi:hypothetical protein